MNTSLTRSSLAATEPAEALPRIAVLLATYNGARFVKEQCETILQQRGVEVDILASDDQSNDGTWELLHALARSDPRLTLLPREKKFGCAAANFFHLLVSIDPHRYDAVAFADQDDVWFDWKLSEHFALLRERGAGGVSSSVVAFWPDGRECRVEKGGTLRRFDHLFQGPGPGCTFLLSPELAQVIKECVQRSPGAASFPFHDWLVYGIARSCGFTWHIDERASMRYRQHGSNEWGANIGWRALRRRLSRLADGTYTDWVRKLIRIARWSAGLMGQPPPPRRISAFDILRNGRRRLSDRLVVALTHPLGVEAEADLGMEERS